MLSLYFFMIVAPVLTVILLALGALLATHRPDAEKLSTYECGFDSYRGQTRSPFTISYYLVAVLFLAFDVEVALLHPYAPSSTTVGLYGFWVVVAFFLVLTLGFVVEVASGVLSFTDHRSHIRHVTLAYKVP